MSAPAASASASRSPPSPGKDSELDDDERNRIATTADGGIWLLRTPYPEPKLEMLADPNDPAAQALRERIRNRYR